MATETIIPPPHPAPIKATNKTCPTPATSVATSGFLPPATSTVTTTTTAPSTNDEGLVKVIYNYSAGFAFAVLPEMSIGPAGLLGPHRRLDSWRAIRLCKNKATAMGGQTLGNGHEDVVCVSTPGTSAPFPFIPSSLPPPSSSLPSSSAPLPAFFPLSSPQSTHIPPPPCLSPSPSLSSSSSPPPFPPFLSLPSIPSSPLSKMSYTEGDNNHDQLEEVGAGYTFFTSGRPKADRRDADPPPHGHPGHQLDSSHHLSNYMPILITGYIHHHNHHRCHHRRRHHIHHHQRWGSVLRYSNCKRTCTARVALVGHLRIHSTGTSKPVPGAPTYSRDRQIHCPHYPRAFTHRMGLFGRMRIPDSRIHRTVNNTDTPCTPSAPATTSTITMNDIPPASPDFSCPHCARNFNSRIGLIDHLRIHRTEAGEPVPVALTYSRRARLHCPHFSLTFT
ncbi:unnamed protein product [Schistocephalus solidus]|uniref:C2H2-type domain-containing protein n=1 Tax=Schistocephalus solidus TaxID=70667 RepID=A0A183T5T0_SCHSO|nr:unnamed protein product [Schistocephalus solidus]